MECTLLITFNIKHMLIILFQITVESVNALNDDELRSLGVDVLRQQLRSLGVDVLGQQLRSLGVDVL